MPLYYMWLETYASANQSIDGARYDKENRTWVIYDFERLKSWIYNATGF